MSGETTITLVGNLVAAPELKFTPSGAAVASFTVASTQRTFDKTKNEWADGETLYMRCSVWRQAAENLAESGLDKGCRVVVQGRLKQRSYEKDGQKRTVVELDVEEVAVSLKYATAKVTKAAGGGTRGNSGRQGSQRQGGQATRSSAPAQDDPWATGGAGGGGWGGSPDTSEPPF